MMPIANMRKLSVHQLRELYDAERRFLEGQQEMIQVASDQCFKSTVQRHIEQTREHIRNLELVKDQLAQEPRREMNEVAQGLVSEAQEG
jgi:ferritin-like metal-binding protein YciE